MKHPDSPWNLLDRVARDLSSALDQGLLPQDRRAGARRLLMDAWLALQGPRRAADRTAAIALARRIDEQVTIGASNAAGTPVPVPTPDRLGIADRLLAAHRSPLEERLSALEGSVDALARRTRRMVEHAEAAARTAGGIAPVGGAAATEGGRQDLELVWGDTET